MSGWWFSRRSRTRRPKEKLTLPGDVVLFTPDRRERLLGWIALRLVYLGLLAGLTWLTVHLLTAPEFQVKRTSVVGNHLVSTEQLLATGDVTRRNVFLVNSRQVEQAVLANKPIRSARLVFRWPNEAVLEVEERRPFGVWQVGNASHLVCQDGVVLAPSSGENLPTIVDVDGPPVSVGSIVDRDVLAEGAFLLTTLNSAGLAVTSLEYSRALGLSVVTERGPRVVFGRGGDLTRKVAVLRALLDELASRQMSAKYIDVRIEDRPYFR